MVSQQFTLIRLRVAYKAANDKAATSDAFVTYAAAPQTIEAVTCDLPPAPAELLCLVGKELRHQLTFESENLIVDRILDLGGIPLYAISQPKLVGAALSVQVEARAIHDIRVLLLKAFKAVAIELSVRS